MHLIYKYGHFKLYGKQKEPLKTNALDKDEINFKKRNKCDVIGKLLTRYESEFLIKSNLRMISEFLCLCI